MALPEAVAVALILELGWLPRFESWVCLLPTVWSVTITVVIAYVPQETEPELNLMCLCILGEWCDPRTARVKQRRRKSKSEVIQQVSITHLPSIRHCCGPWEQSNTWNQSLCTHRAYILARETGINEIGKVYSMSDTIEKRCKKDHGQKHWFGGRWGGDTMLIVREAWLRGRH